jgi:hypothetical protein
MVAKSSSITSSERRYHTFSDYAATEISTCGDGAFFMHANVLGTAIEYDICSEPD